MAKEIEVKASKRTRSGSSAAQALRRQGWMPAVVYGENGARSIQINQHAFEMMLKHQTGGNLIVDLDVDGEEALKVLLREVQRGAVYDEVIHADFVEVSMTRKMRVTIRVDFAGEPVGVTQQGGILEHVLREVQVECLPGDIVDAFTIDVTGLELGHTLTVRDLAVDPQKFTLLTSADMAVATVVAPRLEAEPTPEAEAEAAAPGTEPEVIGKKKEEGEAGEAAPAAGEKKKDEKKDEKKKDDKKK
jgi:large subunit ribosomal protein L25